MSAFFFKKNCTNPNPFQFNLKCLRDSTKVNLGMISQFPNFGQKVSFMVFDVEEIVFWIFHVLSGWLAPV